MKLDIWLVVVLNKLHPILPKAREEPWFIKVLPEYLWIPIVIVVFRYYYIYNIGI